MRIVVYFFKGLLEFIFGSFLPSEKYPQPINPTGAIKSVKSASKKDIVDERREALELLDRCLRTEYRVVHPTKRRRVRG